MALSLPEKWLCPVPSMPVRTLEIAAFAVNEASIAAPECWMKVRRCIFRTKILQQTLRILSRDSNGAVRLWAVIDGSRTAPLLSRLSNGLTLPRALRLYD